MLSQNLSGREDGDLDAFDFDITSGRMFQSQNEIVAGEGLLRMTSKSIGDELVVRVMGQSLTLKIVGSTISNSLDNSNRMFLSSIETLRQIKPEAEAKSYYVKLSEGNDVKAFITAIERRSNGLVLGEAVDHTPPPEILTLRPVVVGLSLVLTFIALLSVFNTTLMGIRERMRELAMLKAVGFTPSQVMRTVLVNALILAVVAVVMGLPIGVVLTYGAFVVLARWQGFTRSIPFVLNWLGLILVPFGTLFITYLGTMLPARLAGRVKVVSLLRYE